ncbi:MAG: type IV pili twitching motility protein PilT [Nautilia sp.]|nr:MAG: type IV pili twitching motility protein PilT [Nautilia sp.]
MAEENKLLQQVKAFLYKMIEVGGSDLYIKSGGYISARIRGDIKRLSNSMITREVGLEICKVLLGPERMQNFLKNKEMDFNFRLDDDYRFRGNAFFQMDGPTVIMRVIPVKIPTLKELNMPQALYKLVEKERGIVLVTGVTGSGKSTTLAAMINEINTNKAKHIITIEDPVEFVHKEKKSVIEQRSVGEDTLSFANALKGALREDPDIILIGEMRDIETIEIALHAAETGHLVFSTLHTLDAKETVNRIIGTFPPEEQNRIRLTLASILEGVISQRLVKTIDNKRAAAMEILLKTARISDLIRENRDSEIKDALEEGREVYGTQSFDDSLVELVLSGRVSKEEALKNASSPDDLALKIKKAQLLNSDEEESEEEDEIIELKL